MKRNIIVELKGCLSEESLENYYEQLCRALRLQYGDEIIHELLEHYENEKKDYKG